MRHRCYYPALAPVLGLINGLAHITGGGLPAKMPAILPENLAAEFHMGSWPVPPIFDIIQREGRVSSEEMHRVFNMGLGMVAVSGEENLDRVRELVPDGTVVGRVINRENDNQVILKGL